MKKLFLFIIVIASYQVDTRLEDRHLRVNIHSHADSEKLYEKYPTITDVDKGHCIVLNNVKIDKYLAYFVYVYPMTIESFYFYLINKYVDKELQACYANKLYDLTPDSLWDFLHDCNAFDKNFIDKVDLIYNYEDFILICKTRMAIEYLVFALNTNVKTTQYQFKYIKQYKLKPLLNIIYEFILKHHNLLNIKNNKIINEMKKVIHAYATAKGSIYIPTFLNELSKYKNILWDLINDSNSDISEPSYREKLSICSRFSSIFNG